MTDVLADAVRKELEKLLGSESMLSIPAIQSLIGKGSGQAHGERVAANGRTKTYKVRRTLEKEPESDDVVAACGYLLLGVLETSREEAEGLLGRLVKELTAAGFSKERSHEVVARLAVGVEERKGGWHRRLGQRRIRRLVAALAEATEPSHTG